jgi:hypothetical protein
MSAMLSPDNELPLTDEARFNLALWRLFSAALRATERVEEADEEAAASTSTNRETALTTGGGLSEQEMGSDFSLSKKV